MTKTWTPPPPDARACSIRAPLHWFRILRNICALPRQHAKMCRECIRCVTSYKTARPHATEGLVQCRVARFSCRIVVGTVKSRARGSVPSAILESRSQQAQHRSAHVHDDVSRRRPSSGGVDLEYFRDQGNSQGGKQDADRAPAGARHKPSEREKKREIQRDISRSHRLKGDPLNPLPSRHTVERSPRESERQPQRPPDHPEPPLPVCGYGAPVTTQGIAR